MGMLENLFKRKSNSKQRTSARRPKQLPILVTGQDENGFTIKERGQIEVVSRQGGCLIFKRDVPVGGKLVLKEASGISFVVEVRSCKYEVLTNNRRVGFKILKPMHRWFETVMANATQSSTQTANQSYADCNWLR
jgi:hypothetical protein